MLDAMARHGVSLPSACRAGSCQACLVRSVSGDPGEQTRRELKPWQADGYFLACLARPAAGLSVARAGREVSTPGRIAGIGAAGGGILRVLVRPARPVWFRPGQHVALSRPGVTTRTYSIANLPGPAARDGLELNVRLRAGGAMSGWPTAATPGDLVRLGQPAGECCYLPRTDRGNDGGQPDGPLLLAGTGTGIAPLVAGFVAVLRARPGRGYRRGRPGRADQADRADQAGRRSGRGPGLAVRRAWLGEADAAPVVPGRPAAGRDRCRSVRSGGFLRSQNPLPPAGRGGSPRPGRPLRRAAPGQGGPRSMRPLA